MGMPVHEVEEAREDTVVHQRLLLPPTKDSDEPAGPDNL